jgi:Reverse transcriptase (RNA-dependent DNA polymerase)
MSGKSIMPDVNDIFGRYLSLFKGREDHFAQQHDSYYSPVAKPLDSFYLRQHFAGDATYGVYVLTSESRCHFFCLDIDIPKDELEETDFKDRKGKFARLGQKLNDTIYTLAETLGIQREGMLLEETGGRGYHVWVFLKESISGEDAVKFGAILKSILGFEIEFFPKQGQITPERKLGNLVKLPLGLHRKYGARSVFFTISGDKLQYIESLELASETLSRVVPIEPASIIATVKSHPEIVVLTKRLGAGKTERNQKRPQFEGDLESFYARCTAINSLRSKALSGNQLTRAEAFHFTNILLSITHGQDCVIETMRASYGNEYDERKTMNEIEKILPLFPTSCATLVEKGICSNYCREGIRKRNTDALLTNTTPCGVWLSMVQAQSLPEAGDLLARIGVPSNIKKSFFQLKAYHEHEDSLFFDTFDFEQFEKDLSANCEIIAAILREKSTQKFAGYLSVEIPKKIDSEYHLVYRRMAYTTIYDQVGIQAVFNVVAPFIENKFLDCSCGYRWNIDIHGPNNIFKDWREAYPRFRGNMVAALRGTPNGFHVCCDIKGYYEHIDHNILIEQLRSIIKDSDILNYISNVISLYRHEQSEAKGVPQGPAYARILANLYLNDLDKFAIRHTKKYLRYVDDLFLFFESREDAENGLQEITQYLSGLGLEFSDSEDKKPIVTPNSDDSRIRKSLDKIQYGILEGTRQLTHWDQQVVSDFSEAVERHKASPATLEELLKLNDYMPSLLYVVTKEALSHHPLRAKVWAIVKYLIEKHWFCPKRLKTVFYRLIDLSPGDMDLTALYEFMEPAHKVYFILSVYGTYLSTGKHKELIECLTGKAIQDEYCFLRGFGIAIGSRLGLKEKLSLASISYVQGLKTVNSYFALGKWVSEIAYLSLGDDGRTAVRELINQDSIGILKLLFLYNLGGEPRTYLDGKYLCNIINESDAMLLPAVCSLLVLATNKSDLFDKLQEFTISRFALKSSVVTILSAKLFDSVSGAGRVQIENQRALFEQVADQEVRRVLLAGLQRISGDDQPDIDGISFAKSHPQLDKYNECFLFGHTGQIGDYNCLELIPFARVRQYITMDIDTLKSRVADLSEKDVLPPVKFTYETANDEVGLQFQLDQGLRNLTKDDFRLDNPSILRALRLAALIFKKACYFSRVLGKAPYINTDNLLVNESGTKIVFRTIGKSLCPLYQIDDSVIGDEEEDIPRMVGILLARLLVGDSRAVREFLKAPHTGTVSFLVFFIEKMSMKAPKHVLSCSRFEYIVDKLLTASVHSEQKVVALYMCERLKGALYKRNSQRVTWYGVSATVDEQVKHLREICNRETLNNFAFSNRLELSLKLKNQLHWVSRQILNLTLNRGIGSTGIGLDQKYAYLVEQFLLSSAIGIEILALYRNVHNRPSIRRKSFTVPQNWHVFHISSSGYERDYEASELTTSSTESSAELICKGIRDAGELSLSQMMLQILLSFEVRVDENNLNICDGGALPASVFRPLAHACLIRVPRIEEDLRLLVIAVLDALRNNDEIILVDRSVNLREDLIILARDFSRIRKGLRAKRYFGVASGQRYFPPDVMCRSFLARTIIAKDSSLLGAPLTSKMPASKYRCSWDLQAGSIVNLVVPEDGLKALLSDLKAGRFFGVKLTYLYSGKMMLVYDLLIVLVAFVLLAACEYGKDVLKDHAVGKAILNSASELFVAILIAGLVKLFWDIIPWIPRLGVWIKSFRRANEIDGSSQ